MRWLRRWVRRGKHRGSTKAVTWLEQPTAMLPVIQPKPLIDMDLMRALGADQDDGRG